MSMVVGGISLDFAGITPSWNENLPYEHTQVGQSRKVEYYFLKCTCLCFEIISRFGYKMSTMCTSIATAKKVAKDSPSNGFTKPPYFSNNSASAIQYFT